MNEDTYYSITLGNNRDTHYSANKAKQLANTIITRKELAEYIDADMSSKKRKLSSNERSRLLKIVKLIHENVSLLPDELDKRKTNYYLGELINSDASPLELEENRGRPKQKITLIFEALLLKLLEENKIDGGQFRTLKRWLEYLGFINFEQIKKFYDTKLLREEVYKYTIQKKEVNGNSLSERFYITTDKQLQLFFNMQTNTLTNLLKNKMNTALKIMDYNNLIHYDSYYIGVDVNTGKHVQLTIEEVAALHKLEVEIKNEKNLHDLTGFKLYNNSVFKEIQEKRLRKGLKTSESNRKFKCVYVAYTISKKLTKVALNKYLKKNKRVKTYYDLTIDELIAAYRQQQLQYLLNDIDKYTKRKNEKEIREKETQLKTQVGKVNKQLHFQVIKFNNQQEAYAKKNLSRKLHKTVHKPFSRFN